jgi:hypothetical protein
MPKYGNPSSMPGKQPSQTVSPPSATQNTLHWYHFALPAPFSAYAPAAPYLTHGNEKPTPTAPVEQERYLPTTTSSNAKT